DDLQRRLLAEGADLPLDRDPRAVAWSKRGRVDIRAVVPGLHHGCGLSRAGPATPRTETDHSTRKRPPRLREPTVTARRWRMIPPRARQRRRLPAGMRRVNRAAEEMFGCMEGRSFGGGLPSSPSRSSEHTPDVTRPLRDPVYGNPGGVPNIAGLAYGAVGSPAASRCA